MSTHHENTATKLRPKSFNELAGQEFVVSTICSSIEKGNIVPAYLFSGPRGVGKTSAARLVALAINRPENTPIDQLSYQGSEDIRLGKSLDVIEIDGASYTSVENVRNIREDIMYAPVHFRYKVFIIDEVHMLSNSAFNALLKTIEEPPSYVVFIFATTELHKVPATIKSRCQQFSFRLISPTEITRQLEHICKTEGIAAESLALQWIAKEAQGSFRDAYTIFDQIKAFSNNEITIEGIQTHLGLAGIDVLNELFSHCLQHKRLDALKHLDTLFSKGVSTDQLVIEAAEYVRNLLLLKSGIASGTLLGIAPEFFKQEIYKGFSIPQLERALALLLECYRNLRYSVNGRFEVELVFGQLCELSQYVTPQELVSQLKKIQNNELATVSQQEPPQMSAQHISPQHSSPPPQMEPQVNQDSPPVQNTVTNAIQQGEQDASLQVPTLSQFIKTQQTEMPSPNTEQSPSHNTPKLWNEIISYIRNSNENFALILDSAQTTENDKSLEIIFKDEFSYKKYTTYADRVLKVAQRIANKPLEIYAKLEKTKSVAEPSELQRAMHDAEQRAPVENQNNIHRSEEANIILKEFGGEVQE